MVKAVMISRTKETERMGGGFWYLSNILFLDIGAGYTYTFYSIYVVKITLIIYVFSCVRTTSIKVYLKKSGSSFQK